MENFIRDAYYGGHCEVFIGYIGGGKGYYYDVKGMYIQAMKQDLPCGEPFWKTDFEEDWLNTNMNKGFCKVNVRAPAMDHPILPFRSEKGKLIFPFGS